MTKDAVRVTDFAGNMSSRQTATQTTHLDPIEAEKGLQHFMLKEILRAAARRPPDGEAASLWIRVAFFSPR